MSKTTALFGTSPESRIRKGRVITKENLAAIFGEIEELLDHGRYLEAERKIVHTLNVYSNSFETQARLSRLLSFALETQGRYSESLKAVRAFEPDAILDRLRPLTRLSILIQLAVAYNNTEFSGKALKILENALRTAEINELDELFVPIHIALARVYADLKKPEIAFEHAEQGLRFAREYGDWYRMAEAYQLIAARYFQTEDYRKSIDFFHQAIKIIGERPAPYLLGKIYTDLSAAYWSLRRPNEGVEALEKSIGLFEETEQKYQATLAYHNLGVNLILLGEWAKAGEMLERSLKFAIETNHDHAATILNSTGELALLRDEPEAAQELFSQALERAEKSRRELDKIQSLKNLARCRLRQNATDEAARLAQQAISLGEKAGEKRYRQSCELILAEILVRREKRRDADRLLLSIEEAIAENDFFSHGEIQRLRGKMALSDYDEQVAAYHFSRALSFYETAEDYYHAAAANYDHGRTLGYSEPEKAQKYLTTAADAFARLGATEMLRRAEAALEKLRKIEIRPATDKSVNAQLLTLRLTEATASRELLFRELLAILQQESKAKKIIVAEPDEQKKFYPLIAHGYTPAESGELAAALFKADIENRVEEFAAQKYLSVFELRPDNAPPATLIVYPSIGDRLGDSTEIKPLLRVVELGMEVCALRERDGAHNPSAEFNPFISQSLLPGFIHSSPAMTALVEEVYRIRSSDVTVLITGESGTGKELVSRAIHSVSPRRDKVFIPFNCTAVPRELAEGYFFGYRRGSFTGAVMDSPGMIRNAEGGTLFLDEVGDLPLEIQPKLLRFLQEGEIQPLGEKRPVQVDVRVVAATNSPLEEKVEKGLFREDLYYRLNVIRLHVPPLRERRSEIPQIVNYYINHYSAKFRRRNVSITPQALDLLAVGDWAGNVRQLCNEVQRLVARAADGEQITPEHLSPELRRTALPIPVKYSGNVRPITSFAKILDQSDRRETIEEAVSQLEIKMINEAMHRHGSNISRVARELGLTRRGLYLKLERYGLDKTGS